MSEALNETYASIDRERRGESASTRRQLIVASSATLGGLGLLAMPQLAWAAHAAQKDPNDPQTILNVAATAEVLATIVNTVGALKVPFVDTPGTTGTAAVTKTNIVAAAKEELIHFDVLVSLGAKPVTTSIFVPDSVFASMSGPQGLLNTVIVGDQIFINAYMIATTVFGLAGNGKLARAASEFMGAEAVHRAVARQSLGLLGNDRVFMKFDQPESAPGPLPGLPGFTHILDAVKELQAAGFGFGAAGKGPGQLYDFNAIRAQTAALPNPGLDTLTPDSSSLGTPAKMSPPRKRTRVPASRAPRPARIRFTG